MQPGVAMQDTMTERQELARTWAVPGGVIGWLSAADHKTIGRRFILTSFAFFLLGGITMVAMFGGPIWFTVLDLLGAYLPMGYLGGMLGGAKRLQPTSG